MSEIEQRPRGAGGTPGGIGEFLIGLLLVIGGGYLFINQVTVVSGGWRFFDITDNFGLSLVPLLLGIGILFFNGSSPIGWVLLLGGGVIIVLGILSNLDIYFRPTSLFNTVLMLGMLAAGLGLVARSLREH